MKLGWDKFDNLNDKAKHFIIMFVYATVLLPIAIGMTERDTANVFILIFGFIIIVGKEWIDYVSYGFFDFFDIFAGVLGLFLGMMLGGGIIAHLLGM